MKIFNTDILIIGAGPAGLTAAYKLIKKKEFILIEKDPIYVGGISRTEKHGKFKFDIGGHRFFSKSKEINDLWHEILPNGFIKRKRISRILFKNKFYNYPLKPFEALFNLGLYESFMVICSFIKARIFKNQNIKSYKDWVCDKFGKRLFQNFFETYTEKVWGMKCSQISADWAAQRIKDLDLKKLVINTIFKNKKNNIKTLIDEFKYPRKGPGMLWEEAYNKIIKSGYKVMLNCNAVEYEYCNKSKKWNVFCNSNNNRITFQCNQIINSSPLKEVVLNLNPEASLKNLAKKLKYRDFITVAVILDYKLDIEDNWIYLHDPSIKAGRLQNFSSWSPEMVDQDKACSCLGLEYFCNEGDSFWNSSEMEIIEIAKKDLQAIKLIDTKKIVEMKIVKQEKAYPVYDDNYQDIVNEITDKINLRYPGMHMVGRNGMHKYNNQDHAMMTSILTVKNIMEGQKKYDPWLVNVDAEYHEEDYKNALTSLRSHPTLKVP